MAASSEVKPYSVEAIWAEIEKFKADPGSYPDYPDHPYADGKIDLVDRSPVAMMTNAWGMLMKYTHWYGNTARTIKEWEFQSQHLLKFWLASTEYYLSKSKHVSPDSHPLSLVVGYERPLPSGRRISADVSILSRHHEDYLYEMELDYGHTRLSLHQMDSKIDYVAKPPQMSCKGSYSLLQDGLPVTHQVDFNVHFIRDRISSFKGNVLWGDPMGDRPSIPESGELIFSQFIPVPL